MCSNAYKTTVYNSTACNRLYTIYSIVEVEYQETDIFSF